MYSIRRFGVVRTATIVAVMYVIAIAIFFVPIALIAGIAGTALGRDAAAGGAGLVGTLVFGLVIALVYGVIGWVFTALGCLLYNLAAGWVGGIHIQLDAVVPPQPTAAWTPAASAPTTTGASGPPPVG